MTPVPPEPDYGDDEYRAFVAQLHRFCSVALDQWAYWRLPTGYGEVYVSITRHPLDGTAPHNYDDLSRMVDVDPPSDV